MDDQFLGRNSAVQWDGFLYSVLQVERIGRCDEIISQNKSESN